VQITLVDNASPFTGSVGVGGHAQGDFISSSIENVTGSGFGDILRGNAQVNRLDGGGGNDVLRGGAGVDAAGVGDALIGGDGIDTVDYSTSAAGVVVGLTDIVGASTIGQGGDAQGDRIHHTVENIIGSAAVDQLVGNGQSNRLDGGAGNDILVGGANDDVLIGGAGADTMLGGTGLDTADYSGATAAVTIVSATINGAPGFVGTAGDANGDILGEIENLIGSGFADSLTGNALDNRLDGGAGNDVLNGGAGVDTVDYSRSASGVNVQITALANAAITQSNVNNGDAAGDRLVNVENLIGSAFDDHLKGSAASNTLISGSGADTLRGGGGDDLLIVDAAGGPKVLFGEGVVDPGVPGGAAGSDTFRILAGNATIMDYQMGEDIQLSSLTAAQYNGAAQTLILRGAGLEVAVLGIANSDDAQSILNSDVFVV
jgi:Ca2+-binding RTX toxin-like protein